MNVTEFVPFNWSMTGNPGYAAAEFTWSFNGRPRLEGLQLYDQHREYVGYWARYNMPLEKIREIEAFIRGEFPSPGRDTSGLRWLAK